MVMKMFLASIVVIVSWVNTHLETHQVGYILNMYNFLYVNHISIQWVFFKELYLTGKLP